MAEEKLFKGVLAAETIEVRFAFSGKVAKVLKNPGGRVKRGEVLATLDTKFLQTELDKELADYERARADFEIFKAGEKSLGDMEKYQKTRIQASLDAAVKQVELAKFRMDQAQLTSPVAGVVLENANLRPGMFITPGSYGFKILDLDSLHLAIEADWNQIGRFPEGSTVQLNIENQEGQLQGNVLPSLPSSKKGRGLARIVLEKADGLWPGMEGRVELK